MIKIVIAIGLLIVSSLAVSQFNPDSSIVKKPNPCAEEIKPNPDIPPLVFVVLNNKEFLVEQKDQGKIYKLNDRIETIEIIKCKKDLVQYGATENGVILIHPKRKHYRSFRKIVKKRKTAPNTK